MAARDWVRRHLGEGAARAIERFAAALFGDDVFITCPLCETPVPANLVCEWGHRPACKASSGQLTTAALLARRNAALEAREAANREVQEINEKLSTGR